MLVSPPTKMSETKVNEMKLIIGAWKKNRNEQQPRQKINKTNVKKCVHITTNNNYAEHVFNRWQFQKACFYTRLMRSKVWDHRNLKIEFWSNLVNLFIYKELKLFVPFCKKNAWLCLFSLVLDKPTPYRWRKNWLSFTDNAN